MDHFFSKAILATFVLFVLSGNVEAQEAQDALGASNQPAQTNPVRTPFSFVQRVEIGQEIGITEAQLDRVDRFQPICDAICQTKVREQMEAMPAYLQNIYQDMTFEQRLNAKGLLEQDMQEETELQMLDSQILNSDQMTRFGQLWTQQSGLGGLMSGTTSRQLGMTEPQKSSISQIQNVGNQAMDACLANPNLTQTQKNLQIQQIQNITINQSINILNADQINIYVGLCGKKFDFSGPGDSDKDELVSDASADVDEDAADAGNATEVEESNGSVGSDGGEGESNSVGEIQIADAGTLQSRQPSSSKVRGFGSNARSTQSPRSFGSASQSKNQSVGTRSFSSNKSSNSSGSNSSTRGAKTPTNSSGSTTSGNSAGPSSNSNSSSSADSDKQQK